MILHLGYTCYHLHLLSHRLLVLHPNEHVDDLDLVQELQELQELFLRISTIAGPFAPPGVARPERLTFDQGL